MTTRPPSSEDEESAPPLRVQIAMNMDAMVSQLRHDSSDDTLSCLPDAALLQQSVAAARFTEIMAAASLGARDAAIDVDLQGTPLIVEQGRQVVGGVPPRTQLLPALQAHPAEAGGNDALGTDADEEGGMDDEGRDGDEGMVGHEGEEGGEGEGGGQDEGGDSRQRMRRRVQVERVRRQRVRYLTAHPPLPHCIASPPTAVS
ncbi:unnamed protein product [Closterium sp. Naga37s-1]|nr:unnamed protein product [Closterium sp. Naga37s-1]